jgi:hypothetical protein
MFFSMGEKMKNENLRVATLAGRIALTIATVCAPVAVMAAPATGGVITFVGALTAPGFTISAGAVTGAHASTATQTQGTDTRDGTTYVSFVSDPHNPSNADVSLSVVGQATSANTLAARFRDGKGRIVKPNAGGMYHVGALGGTLSVRANDKATSPALVTLITNYQ